MRGFSYFVHGILIERTPYKDTVYVWHLMSPMFFKKRNIELTYSSRIRSNDLEISDYSKGDDQAIVDLVLTRLRETGLIDTVSHDITLDEYLPCHDRTSFRRGDKAKVAAYRAAAAFLAGDRAWSSEWLDFCTAWLAREQCARDELGEAYSPFMVDLKAFIPLFDGTPAEVTRRLHAIVRDNADRLGFIAGNATKDISHDR